MHACDIMEDVAIAYGYNNIVKKVPQTVTVGAPQPINKVTDLVRIQVANAGYTEILAFSLCSLDDNFKNLRRPNDGSAVILDSNSEFQCGRITLLGGMLRSVSANKASQLPIRVFEVGEVFMKNPNTDTGAANKRLLAGVYCATVSSFETIHGLVDRVMQVLRVDSKKEQKEKKEEQTKKLLKAKEEAKKTGKPVEVENPENWSTDTGYCIAESTDPAFFEGRRVDILVGDRKIGVMGVVHPEVLQKFDIPHPCTAFELELSLDLARWHDRKNFNTSTNTNNNNNNNNKK